MEKNAWKKYSLEELNEVEALSISYKKFLDDAKTEREAVTEIIKRCENEGFKDLDFIVKNKSS